MGSTRETLQAGVVVNGQCMNADSSIHSGPKATWILTARESVVRHHCATMLDLLPRHDGRHAAKARVQGKDNSRIASPDGPYCQYA